MYVCVEFGDESNRSNRFCPSTSCLGQQQIQMNPTVAIGNLYIKSLRAFPPPLHYFSYLKPVGAPSAEIAYFKIMFFDTM